MYYLPEIYDTRDYLCPVSENAIEICSELCTFTDNIPCDRDVYNLVAVIMSETELTLPNDPNDALELYIILRAKFLEII